jgi:hypothetical protein
MAFTAGKKAGIVHLPRSNKKRNNFFYLLFAGRKLLFMALGFVDGKLPIGP